MNQEYARVARTAACPCGSGRRYKDCHGSIRGAADAAVQPAGLDSLLREALAAQQAGRFAEASAKYEAALALQPAHFDALHMLGVVCLQLDQLERAEALVRSALSLRVTPAAEYNLNLIQEAQRIRAGESRLSRSVLPALERLLVPPAHAQRFLSRARSTAHVVVAESGSAELVDRIVAAFRNHARIRVWRSGSAEPAVRHTVEAEAFGSEVVADSDVIIVVGTGVPLGTWTFDSPATARVLVVTRDAPGDVLDRIREFSAQGRQPVLACFADPPVQRALSLRGIVIDDLPALAQRSLDGSLPTTSPLAVTERPVVAFSGPRPVRTIAFYLPQFHPIRENDEWWGPGFTEWTNVRRGEPQFLGHYQPHEPAAPLGYYDLRDPAVRAAQAELARVHGIDGFCYYFYWFNGKRLLERPLDDMLASGVPDFPFCICWANENWTRRWDGLEQEVLLAQQYGMDDAIALVRSWIATVLRDRRYIRVDGRPLVLVYKAQLIPDLAAVAATWRRLAREELGTDLYLCACETGDPIDPRAFGFDAAVEFPPHRHRVISLNARLSNRRPAFAGTVTSYRSQVVQSIERPLPSYPLHRTVMPAWDNTARRQSSGLIFSGSSPELFGEWARSLAAQVSERRRGDERLLFVNAWNEWGEGCHLEPDMRYGLQYLDALRDALAAAAQH